MFRLLFACVATFVLPALLPGQNCAPPVDSGKMVKAPISEVRFDRNEDVMPSEKRLQIVKQLRSETRAAWSKQDMSNLADEAAERVRAAYQDEGYFKVEVEARAQLHPVNVARGYDIMVRTASLGKQYRLGDLNIIRAAHFPTQQLRDLFPIQRGEIFSREKIAKGLEELRRLYGSQGYVNFTSVPETEFEDGNAIINLTVDADEGPVFHWGNLHADGMREGDQEVLLQAWEEHRGNVYWTDSLELDDFLERFFYPLRKGKLVDCTFKKLNDKDGTVDVYLNFTWNPEILNQLNQKP